MTVSHIPAGYYLVQMQSYSQSHLNLKSGSWSSTQKLELYLESFVLKKKGLQSSQTAHL